MSLEGRLRDAFAHRTETVEPSPGALFEIQRRLSSPRRIPEVRLRPALVLAAAACALTIALVATLSGTDAVPEREIVTPLAPANDPPVTTAAAPPTTDPTPQPPGTPPPPATPDPTAPGEIAAVAPQAGDPPPAVDPPVSPLPPSPGKDLEAPPPAGADEEPPPPAGAAVEPPPPAGAAVEPPPRADAAVEPPPPAGAAVEPPPPAGADDEPLPADAAVEPPPPAGADEEAPPPAGADVEPPTEQPAFAEGTVTVTVHFACGDDDAAPRLRATPANDLTTALSTLVAGPNDADTEAGCQGLRSSGEAPVAVPSLADRWVTVDLSGSLAGAFGSITPAQFVAQLNATVFEFDDVDVAEYRLDGSCAAFGELLGRRCEVHTRSDTRFVSHVSELTAQVIGQSVPVIRTQADDGAAELGALAEGTRLTDRRASGSTTTWAQVITSAGQIGWVPTTKLAAQPLSITPEATRVMEDLARRLTTGPSVQQAEFSPAGLVLRWGAGSDEVTLIPTAGADGDWWYQARDIPSPRNADPTASLADLFWIDGSGNSAKVTINTPGRLGEPHSDFDSLAYVSIYQAAVGDSILPPTLEARPDPDPPDPQADGGATDDGTGLPPQLPVDTETTEDETGGDSQAQVKVSVMFDFVSPNQPRIIAVEAIWEPLT